MIVADVMVKKLVCIKTTDSLKTAQELMVKHSIRHLPVTQNSTLLGIITESDIRGAFILDKKLKILPDPAQMKVSDYMTRNPMVVSPDANIEDAALLIYRNKIGALPVVKNGKLTGLVSIMDMLGLFIDMMGILHSSSRVDVVMDKNPKSFEKVTGIFHKDDISIISVGISPFGKSQNKQVYSFRLDLCQTAPVVKEIEKAGFTVAAAID